MKTTKAMRERAKELIDLLPEDAIRELLMDLQDTYDLKKAIEEADPEEWIELDEFLNQLETESQITGE